MEGRSGWLVATLGPLRTGVMQVSYGAPTHGAEENRLIRRPSCGHRRIAHVWVEKLEQGPEKSGCFKCLLRWSFGRHRLLRSRCTYFPPLRRSCLSALPLIALKAELVEIAKDVPADTRLLSIKGLVGLMRIPPTLLMSLSAPGCFC